MDTLVPQYALSFPGINVFILYSLLKADNCFESLTI